MTRRSTFRTLSAAVVSVIVLATTAVGLSVWRDRDKAIAEGVRETRNVATMLGGQIARSIQAIDIVLHRLQAQVEDELARTDFDGRAILQLPGFHGVLQGHLLALPQALHIIVVDHEGAIVASSSDWPAPAINVADRAYFAALRAATDDRMHVSEPVANRITGEPAHVVARRLNGPDGTFRGIVFISFRAAYLDAIFASFEARPGQNVALARPDGTILRNFPTDGRIPAGAKVTRIEPYLAAVSAGGGAYRLVSAFDGIERWSAVVPLQDYPLVVFTGIPEHTLLADWRVAATATAVQAVLLLGVALLLLATIAAQFRRLSASEASLETTSRSLDTALNNMSQGLVMYDAAARLIVCNGHFRRMFSLPAALTEPGTALIDILSDCYRRWGRPEAAAGIAADISRRVARGETWEHDIACPDRVLAVRNTPMRDGGWVATFEDVTARRADEGRIRNLAHNDVLTGIANRTRFLDHLAEAEAQLAARTRPFAVLLLDVDHFKRVNDSLGHAAGDLLLKDVAARLAAALGDGDRLARVGGDEFAVVQAAPRAFASLAVAQADMRGHAAALAGRIIAAVGRPFEIDGRTLVVGTSVGIAIAPYDGTSADELMKRADLALYKAKSDGRNVYAFFDPSLAAAADDRHRLEQDMRAGLARGEFELFYQPQVDAATRAVRGVEALVRWRRPGDGLIAPDRFIPLAEDTGLIHPLGEWILVTACAAAKSFPDAVKVAVNISPVQFRKANLFEVVRRALASSGLPPHRLELEITERVLLDADTGTLECLHRLKTLGVSIALDDFGTGYASLGYLTQFRFDKIKIDRSFTRDLLARDECAAVTAAVINLGRLLDVTTLAEGVETEAQYEALRAAGVTQMQGYLFGRPMPAAALAFAADDAATVAGAA